MSGAAAGTVREGGGVLAPTDVAASGLRLTATYAVPGTDPVATAAWLAEEMTVEDDG